MEFLEALFIQGWPGLLIGISGIIIALFIYRASRIGPRPGYQLRVLRLIGKEEQALPEEVEILFKGRTVPRLTKNHVILWNSGNAMLDGRNIIVDDPLCFEYSECAEILRVRVLKVTRDSNKFTANINPNSTNEVICSFDYLEAGDGAVIEILHTAEERYPKDRGTIRGVPKGLSNWGDILPYRRRVRPFFISHRQTYFLVLFLGVFLLCSGFLPQIILKFLGSPRPLTMTFSHWIIVCVGLLYVFLSSYMLWISRRRFPKSLAIEDIED